MKIRGEGRTRSDHALHRIEQLSGGYCTIGVRVGVVKTGGGNEPALGCVNRLGSREGPALVPRRCPRQFAEPFEAGLLVVSAST